jgi:MFS superfamily sulfate permease-like transporter
MITAEPGRIARPDSKASQTGWMRWVPALQILRPYDPSWFRHDVVAGLVMTTMLVPVGILFHARVLDAIASSPTPVRWLVVTAEPVTSVDVTAADALCELDEVLHKAGIEMCSLR